MSVQRTIKGMGGHHLPNRGLTDTWLTPPKILEAIGPFDLDPCCPPKMPWMTAKRMLTEDDDGLTSEWFGRVYCNPPYGPATGEWLRRMAMHNHGTALIFARTETADWHDWIWPKAAAILFIRGRLYFHHVDGSRAKANSGAPSALVAYGQYDAIRLAAQTMISGKFIWLRTSD